MSEFELFFDFESDYGDGVVLNKYGDRYSIIAARKSKKSEGTIYKDWCFPQDADKQPRAKAIPLGVRLGNRAEALQFAKWLVMNLQPQEK